MSKVTTSPPPRPPAERTVGTRIGLADFWRLARGADPIFAYTSSVLRDTARAAGVSFYDARVLDLACGDRQIAVPDQWGEAALRVGLDYDPATLRANRDIDAGVCGDIHALPFPAATFDVLVSVDTIEHSDRPDVFLAELGRVLRSGGTALVFTPHLWGYKTLIARLGGRFLFDLVWRLFYRRTLAYDAFYRANTRSALERLAGEAGLRLREVYYVAEIPHFFYRSRLLSMAALAYNALAVRLGVPRLLTYMMAVLERP